MGEKKEPSLRSKKPVVEQGQPQIANTEQQNLQQQAVTQEMQSGQIG